jgi:hypothetical protein
VQPDPAGLGAMLSDGPSFYGYVGGSPETGRDPSGLLVLPPDPSGLPPGWENDPSHKDPNSTKWRGPNGGCLEYAPGQPGANGWAGKPHWHDCTDKARRKRHWSPGENCPQPEDDAVPQTPDDPPVPVPPPPTPFTPWWLKMLPYVPFIPFPGNPLYGGA